MSRDQAQITGHAGHFFIEGRGSQPVFLNGVRLENYEPNALRNGDLIAIADFSIGVREATQDDVEPADSEEACTPVESSRSPASEHSPGSIDDWLGPDAEPDASVVPIPSNLDVAEEILGVPSPIAERRIPTNFLSQAKNIGAEPIPPPSEGGARSDDFLRTMLEAAGITGADVNKVQAAELGGTLRVAVEGLIGLLGARASVKRELRVSRTEWQPSRNNPLKMSTSAEEAIAKLFVADDPDCLNGGDAFEDAFEDIRAHEFALVKAMGAAFDHLLRTFDPARIGESASGKSRGSFPALGAKGKFWDQYVEDYERWTADRDDAFRLLFMNAFSDAYEKELARGAGDRPRSTEPSGRGC